VPTSCNIPRRSQKEALVVKDFRRKYQEEEEVRCQKPEVEAFKMCLDEEELIITIFAILIHPLVGSIILYILVMHPLPYEKPRERC